MSVELTRELREPEPYPTLQLLRTHRESASVAAGLGTFLFVLGTTPRRDASVVLRALFLGLVVGFGVRNLGELNDLIADTLLPQ